MSNGLVEYGKKVNSREAGHFLPLGINYIKVPEKLIQQH